jgi:hypothetical protein
MKEHFAIGNCLAFIAIICASTSAAGADESCPTKIYITRDCVPAEIVAKALDASTPNSFLEMVRSIYSEGVAQQNKKNSPLSDSDEAPGNMLVSANLALTVGLFGRDFETLRQGQIGLLQAFCTKHGGTTRTSQIVPRSRKVSGFVDTEMTICSDKTGSALAGVATFQAKDTRLGLDNLFAYYLGVPVAQSVLDFRSGLKPGDKPQSGMVVDVRGAIAKVQIGREEKWIEIEKLVPNDLKVLARLGY